MKRCAKCREPKPLSEFYKAKGTRDGYRGDCKACFAARRKVWYAANRERVIANVKRWQQENRERVNAQHRAANRAQPERVREGHLRRTFGISLDDYSRLLERQGGGCAICGQPPKKAALHVDHDHATGEIRGLLCVSCNNGLGQFRESVDLMGKALDYLSLETRPCIDDLSLADVVRARAGLLRVGAV